MYHRLGQIDSSSSLIVSPESFEFQIRWLKNNHFRFLTLDEVVENRLRIPLWERAVALSFDDGFRDNYVNGFSLLLQKKKTAALFVVVDWVGKPGFMTWEEIRRLADAGMTIGSHSLTHRWLPDISDDHDLRREIFDSKKILEDRLSREIRHFAYPVGGMDKRVGDFVKEAGYQAAWVAGARPTASYDDPDFSIRRLKIGARDYAMSRFAFKAFGLKGIFG